MNPFVTSGSPLLPPEWQHFLGLDESLDLADPDRVRDLRGWFGIPLVGPDDVREQDSLPAWPDWWRRVHAVRSLATRLHGSTFVSHPGLGRRRVQVRPAEIDAAEADRVLDDHLRLLQVRAANSVEPVFRTVVDDDGFPLVEDLGSPPLTRRTFAGLLFESASPWRQDAYWVPLFFGLVSAAVGVTPTCPECGRVLPPNKRGGGIPRGVCGGCRYKKHAAKDPAATRAKAAERKRKSRAAGKRD